MVGYTFFYLRAKETQNEKSQRLAKKREYDVEWKSCESEEHRKNRLERQSELTNSKRKTQTPEQKLERQIKDKNAKAAKKKG